ncbi:MULTISPECIES: hypothetical protein [Burkholderia cepacia complex]|uniref:hypothetical protein n=1 Tax=Burkholderia cepacia complex TaxID=87882 RepID=UPI00159004BA|nr:hypothetical protein [Burkholderia cepacia]
MNASKPAFPFPSVVVGLAVAALLTACSNDYRGDASALPRNEPLTAALRGHASDTTYTLPNEIQSLNCFFARNGMNCDVALDVRDPDVAKELRNPARRVIDLDDKSWHRGDGRVQPLWNRTAYLELSEAKFNFIVERDARVGGWGVRANVDVSRVPFEEAAALMLLGVMDTASEYTATLKELYAKSPRANAESWGNVTHGLGGTSARPMSDTASHAAVNSPPAAASSVGIPNIERSAAAASNRPGAAK